jgi:hypothetical protein
LAASAKLCWRTTGGAVGLPQVLKKKCNSPG